VVKVIKLQIWVLGELVLDNSLVNLLAIVLLGESLLDVPVSLFLRLSQDGGLDHLEMRVDDLLDIVDPPEEQATVFCDVLLDDIAHVAQLEEVLPDLVNSRPFRRVSASWQGLVQILLCRFVDVKEGLEVLKLHLRSFEKLGKGHHVQFHEQICTVVGPL